MLMHYFRKAANINETERCSSAYRNLTNFLILKIMDICSLGKTGMHCVANGLFMSPGTVASTEANEEITLFTKVADDGSTTWTLPHLLCHPSSAYSIPRCPLRILVVPIAKEVLATRGQNWKGVEVCVPGNPAGLYQTYFPCT